MADNVIKVSVTSTKSQRVSVSSSQQATNITASPDTGRFWSQTSKNWAVSENIVDGEDYSSKYYANKSKGYAQNAESFELAARETYNTFVSDANSYIEELTQAKDEATEEINEAVASGKDEISSAKTTILNDIEFVADGEKKEIQELADNAKDDIKSTGFYMRDDKLYFINSKGEEEEFQSGGAGLQMFDTILKDHVLTYEESKGLALQGTYVYKNAVAGSRYGYADFYNKCLEEYNEATDSVPIRINATCEGGVVSDFVFTGASNAYIKMPITPPLSTADSWEFQIKHTYAGGGTRPCLLGASSTNNMDNLHIVLVSNVVRVYLSSNGSSWDIAEAQDSSLTLVNGTTYYLKIGFTGSEYYIDYNTDGSNSYTRALTIASTARVFCNNPVMLLNEGADLGYYYASGSIDLKETRLIINNGVYWQGVARTVKNPNGHIFYDISQKDQIDEIFATTGSAWMYGIDQENERIFLPRDKYFAIKGSVDTVPVIGNGITLGLTNGSSYGGLFASDNGGMAGALNADSDIYGKPINSGTGDTVGNITRQRGLTITSDPAKSGVIADTSNVVQPNEDKYLYICVGNTEATSAVTEVVEVTTTENDTTPLFTGMYFDFTPNNVSWLKAGEQKQSGGVYATCYNELVNELTSPKYGLKVINEADMIAGIDYSEYWKVNQDEMTFTTPTAISNKALSGAVVGNGMTLGLSKGESNYGLVCKSGIGFTGSNSAYGKPEASSDSNESLTPGQTYGVTTDPTKSGIIAEESTAQLYFKVANAVQNLELLDAGEVLEAVNNVVPNNSSLISSYAMPSNRYIDLTLGASGTTYTAPATGWVSLVKNTGSGQTDGNILVAVGACEWRTFCTFAGTSAEISVPVAKGQSFKITYNLSGETIFFRFVYAEGDK